MPVSKNRTLSRLRLTVTAAGEGREPAVSDSVPFLPWPLAALAAGLVAALGGWLLITGLALVSWFTAMAIPIQTVLRLSSQVWLLAHGGPALVGGVRLSLAPLGLTAMCAAWCVSTSAWAARQALLARTELPGAAERGRLALQVSGLVSASYLAAAIALVVTTPGSAVLESVAGAAAVSVLSSIAGALAAVRYPVSALMPAGAVPVLAGAAAGLLVLAVGGAAVLSTGLLVGGARVAAIEHALALEGAGAFVWSVTALLYLPNALLWSVAWALGAGFSFGAGSLVSLAGSQLGMLPAIPVLGAVPVSGVAAPWLAAWLCVGVLAGVAAGVASVKRGAEAGLVRTAAIGGSAGATAALVTVALAALSGGDLGHYRLVGLGPRLPELVLIATPLLGLTSALAALLTLLRDRRRRIQVSAETTGAETETVRLRDSEATVLLRGGQRNPLLAKGDEVTVSLASAPDPTGSAG